MEDFIAVEDSYLFRTLLSQNEIHQINKLPHICIIWGMDWSGCISICGYEKAVVDSWPSRWPAGVRDPVDGRLGK